MDSNVNKHPISTTPFKELSQENEATSTPSRVQADSFQNCDISNAQLPHVPASTNTATAMDLPSQSNFNSTEEPNKSGTSYLRLCLYGGKCFKHGCRFRHPTKWYVCETSLNCQVYACKGTHPPHRSGPCRFGGKCSNLGCKWLHPETRLIENRQANEYRQSEYNKPYSTDRLSQYHNVAEWDSQLHSHLRLPDSNLGPNGAKYIDQSGPYLHLSHQNSPAQQLSITVSFKSDQKSKRSDKIDFFLLPVRFFRILSRE